MWVIKIGGSWIKSSNLKKLILLTSSFFKEKFVIVPGGGIFADSVREASKYNVSERTGHFLALKATEMFGYLIKSMNSNLHLTANLDNFREKNLWMPSKKLKNEIEFEKNWESTSDSVASWLYSNTASSGLIYIKSLSLGLKNKYKIKELQKRNILDQNFEKYLKKKKKVFIIGPEILELYKRQECLDDLLLNLNSVDL